MFFYHVALVGYGVSVNVYIITYRGVALHSRIEGEEVRLMLWDTAGQEEFDAITKAYYRGAHACVLAFSTTDRDSFLALHSWKLKVCLLNRNCHFIILKV